LFLDESHPPILQFLPLIEDKGDERAHVLDRKCWSGYAALTFVDKALCRKQTTTDEPFYDPSGWCRLLIDCRVFQDVGYRERVEWKQTGFPLRG